MQYDTNESCSIPSTKTLSASNGKWTPNEHQKFIESLFIFGIKWKMMQRYIKTRTAIQIRSHSQKFFFRMCREYIKFYGKDEMKSDNIPTQTNRIMSLLSTVFQCNFITNFMKITEEALPNKTSKIAQFIDKKKENFIKTILNIMNNETSKNDKKQNNTLKNSPKSTAVSEEQTEEDSTVKNDQCLKDYFQDIKEEKLIKDDIFNISFNVIVLDDIDTSNEYYEHNDNYLSYFSL